MNSTLGARVGAGGENRTLTLLSEPRILSPVRLPVSPPRRKVSGVIVATTYVDCFDVSAFERPRLPPRFVPATSGAFLFQCFGERGTCSPSFKWDTRVAFAPGLVNDCPLNHVSTPWRP